MADQSLFNYPVMEQAASDYERKADDIRDLVAAIKNKNQELVTEGWNGDSALAFQERFENDHAKKMEDIVAALMNISSTLKQLVQERQEWEREQAGKFKG